MRIHTLLVVTLLYKLPGYVIKPNWKIMFSICLHFLSKSDCSLSPFYISWLNKSKMDCLTLLFYFLLLHTKLLLTRCTSMVYFNLLPPGRLYPKHSPARPCSPWCRFSSCGPPPPARQRVRKIVDTLSAVCDLALAGTWARSSLTPSWLAHVGQLCFIKFSLLGYISL